LLFGIKKNEHIFVSALLAYFSHVLREHTIFLYKNIENCRSCFCTAFSVGSIFTVPAVLLIGNEQIKNHFVQYKRG